MDETLELGELPHGHISYSAYAQYLRCPHQYYLRHIEGLKEPPKGNLILGRATHSGLEWGFNEYLKVKKHPPKKEVQEVAVSEMERQFQETAASEIGFSDGDNPGKLKDDSVKLLEVYDGIRTKLAPVAVEKAFTVDFSNTTYTLDGRVDLETREGGIIDFKTTARTPSDDAAQNSEQLTVYQIQAEKPKSLEIHALIRKKVPEYKILKTAPRSQEAVNGVLSNIAKVATLIKAGIFPKMLEGAPGSPCSWCGFYERCRGKRRPE